jgi:CheY-like chemotaxis protein
VQLKRIATAFLVDDDPASRLANLERLEGQGYSVFWATSEADALSRVKQTTPNVVFVHLVGNGHNLAFIQSLRSDDDCRHIPVVVIGGRQPVDQRQKGLRVVRHEGW